MPIDTDVGFYTAIVDTGGPETARAAPLCTRGGCRARRYHRRLCDIRECFAVGCAVCARMSQGGAFEASELEIGRPPRPDREAEAVGIVLKVASVRLKPLQTRIGRRERGAVV